MTVPRLKRLFLYWSQLGNDEKQQLDAKVATWYSSSRRQLYKPLQEALIRWETVQDTQGAPGCEPGMVSFSCDPQLEEELVSVICSLEMLFTKNPNCKDTGLDHEIARDADFMKEISLTFNSENSLRSLGSPKERTPHSVHSCGYIGDYKKSDDEYSGYLTN
ncbi:hypothetical protein KM043_009471 [Ampulex compressa]|nr:hypothetical protein KM043_009471 [Ampulex compressa]